MSLSERALEILDRYNKTEDVIETTKKFVYEMLGPTPDRGDMLYRYEHSVRVAENGRNGNQFSVNSCCFGRVSILPAQSI